VVLVRTRGASHQSKDPTSVLSENEAQLDPRPRVSFVANHGEFGGGEVMLLRMAESSRAIVEPTVIGPSRPTDLQRACEATGLRYVSVPGSSSAHTYLRALRRTVRAVPSDLIWCNGGKPAFAAAGLQTPRVIHLHKESTASQRVAIRLARLGAVATVVPSGDLARAVRGAVVLENWTDDPKPLSKTESNPVLTIGYLGRLSTGKGVHLLAQAVHSLRERSLPVELIVGGDFRFVEPEKRAVVERAFADLGDGVTLLGWVDPEEIFTRSDVLVVPSVMRETFCLVVAEAMAAGVPVAVSSAGALREVVGEGYPWIFPADDAPAIAATLEKMRDNPELVRSMVSSARSRWEQRYSPAAGDERFQDLLVRLCST